MAQNRRNRPAAPRGKRGQPGEDAVWIWGAHAVRAALDNPRREISAVYLTRNAATGAFADVAATARIVTPNQLSARLPDGAVHQGAALEARPLKDATLEDLVKPAEGVLLLLDGVTDPRNAGAIYRTAAAFGARGVILQDRKAPPLSGGLAKTAVGAAETVPTARVVNLSRALGELRKRGWRAIGLAGEADITLPEAIDGESALVLALGAEEKGLRPSVAEACDALARIPIAAGVESLNVSVAAAVALYEWRRAQS